MELRLSCTNPSIWNEAKKLKPGDNMTQTAEIQTLSPRQNGGHFAKDIFKCIIMNKNVWISIEISPKFVPKYPIKNIQSLL